MRDWVTASGIFKAGTLENQIFTNLCARNDMAKIGYGHLCMREENISFSNNYIIYELNIPIITIYNKP